MANTQHTIQATPALGWVLERQAAKAAAPKAAATPLGAWIKMRQDVVSAHASATRRMDAAFLNGEGAAAGNAAYAAERAAFKELKAFDRQFPRPRASTQWRDMNPSNPRDDALIQAIFGKAAA